MEMILTIIWDLPCSPLQQQTHSSPSRLDQLDGPGVGHVPRCLAIDLNDLVSNLSVRKKVLCLVL